MKTFLTMPPASRGTWQNAAAALMMAGALWTGGVTFGQIQVDVITSGPEAADNSTTAAPSSEVPVDNSADQAAQKIVPAPGTEMKSTEQSTLTDSGAVAQEPSIKVDENAVVLQTGETTETLAVNSGAELLRMLGLQLKKRDTAELRELDVNTTNSLFDVDAIRRLKGSEPTVVYRVVVEETPLPDPMIVPWIRQAKLLQERFDAAVELLGQNKVEEGREQLLGIIEDFPDSDYAIQARALLTKLDDLNKPLAVPTPVPTVKKEETTVTVELSPNIQIGTVIVDPQNPSGNRAMIGGRSYKAGDPVGGEPGHRVVSITEDVVQIEVEQSGVKKTFDVPVRPRGASN